MDAGLVVLILGVAAFSVVTLMLPFFISRMRAQGFVGKDMNKPDRPDVADLGGIPVYFGFASAIIAAIFLFTTLHLIAIDLTLLFASAFTISLIVFIGVFDDIIGWKKGIRQYQHALFPVFAALPLMAVKAGTTAMTLPVIGLVNFGIFYALVLVPVGVTGASNATNMLAGLNGLESGLGILMASTLLIVALVQGKMEAAIILAALIGALLAFARFNWFPAKIFPGDGVTLMVGATLASASIIGDMEKIGVIVMALFFIEFFLKARRKFQAESFGKPDKKGRLRAPDTIGSLTHVVMRWGKNQWTEKQVVMRILFLQLIVCLATLAYFYLNYIQFFKTILV